MEPIYVYQFKEMVNYPKSEKWALRVKIRNAYFIILLLIFVFSLFFGENLLKEMDWTYKIILLCIGIGLCNTGGHKRIPSDIEIQFFDEYMLVYKDKIPYNPKKSRREYEKCFYTDIKNMEYRTNTKRLNIDAKYEGTYYNYKNGILEEKPAYHKTVDALIWFYPGEAYQTEIIEMLEKYTNKKVNIREGM